MVFVRQFDVDHLIIPGFGRVWLLVGADMASGANLRSKVLAQSEQGMVAAVGDLEALLFLSCLRCCNNCIAASKRI